MKKIVTLINTEYHIFLFLNYYQKMIEGSEFWLFLPCKEERRFAQNLNFESLENLKLIEFSRNNLDNLYSEYELQKILGCQINEISEFNFFQEMDYLNIHLAFLFKKNNVIINLFQDGTKAYFKMNGFFPLLLKHQFLNRLRLNKNLGYSFNLVELRNYKKYANYKFIDNILLTNPDFYENWNGKQIMKIDFEVNKLKTLAEQVFNWDKIVFEGNNCVLYIGQPMDDNGEVEKYLISKVSHIFKNYKIYIKPHPLSSIENYSELIDSNVEFEVIKSKIPAEVFIMNMTNSVILSINSTSQILPTDNKSYYLFPLVEKQVKRLRKINFNILPKSSIVLVSKWDDIL